MNNYFEKVIFLFLKTYILSFYINLLKSSKDKIKYIDKFFIYLNIKKNYIYIKYIKNE